MDEQGFQNAVDWIAGWLRERNPDTVVTHTTRPYDDGLLDSFQTVEMVTELEDRFGVFFEQCDFVAEDFQSVEGLARLVAARTMPLAS